jgi:hypothetical protein
MRGSSCVFVHHARPLAPRSAAIMMTNEIVLGQNAAVQRYNINCDSLSSSSWIDSFSGLGHHAPDTHQECVLDGRQQNRIFNIKSSTSLTVSITGLTLKVRARDTRDGCAFVVPKSGANRAVTAKLRRAALSDGAPCPLGFPLAARTAWRLRSILAAASPPSTWARRPLTVSRC